MENLMKMFDLMSAGGGMLNLGNGTFELIEPVSLRVRGTGERIWAHRFICTDDRTVTKIFEKDGGPKVWNADNLMIVPD